jgi:hypothetical protein
MAKPEKHLELIHDKAVGETTAVACTRCACNTTHKVLNSTHEEGAVERTFDEYQWVTKYYIIQCQGCQAISFMKIRWDSDSVDEDNDWIEDEELFPSRAKTWPLIDDIQLLPPDLARIYRETVMALNAQQPVLTGIGIRAIIETITNEKHATGGNLVSKIDDLVAKGVLTSDGAAILHKIRTLGNAAAHEVKAHGAPELKLAMNVIEHLFKAVYILPEQAKKTFI